MADSYLKDFYQRLDLKPLVAGAQEYVPIYEGALHAADPVQVLHKAITWAEQESAHLFSGFRGTGKSTELRRLQALLERDGEYVVVRCDMSEYLNLGTPVDVSDFLLAVAGALGDGIAARLGDGDPIVEGYWTRFLAFLERTNVHIEGVELGSTNAGAALKLNLKQDPTIRQRIQKRMMGHLGALVEDVRAYVTECVLALSAPLGAEVQLVLLLDSLEQIRGSTMNAEEVASSLVQLFHGHADKLSLPLLHVVYTLPPWLKIREPGITQHFKTATIVPCVKVATREGQVYAPGLDAMEQVVCKRGDWKRLLGGRDRLDKLILASGGHFRELFRLLRAVLMRATDASLPVSDEVVERAIEEVRQNYLPIAHDDAQWLARIDHTHAAELQRFGDLHQLARFLDNMLVLSYRNGDAWWAVHPLVRDEVRRQVLGADGARP